MADGFAFSQEEGASVSQADVIRAYDTIFDAWSTRCSPIDCHPFAPRCRPIGHESMCLRQAALPTRRGYKNMS
ncbi:unnamed protein product [Leptidea sinapis]|uniref:Uncharacterized protein n=1 Tax=Leptidea sinapis TaxID=189913 RepID=A0A5E4Q105_9NEOP|nr:unnamed protein product [Leptidea sinapis]